MVRTCIGRVCLIGCVIPTLLGSLAVTQPPGVEAQRQGQPRPLTTLPFPEVNNARLTELAAQVVILHSVPGMGIAVVDSSGVRAMGVAGVRRAGEPERIQPEDKFHIGSCGKAFTSTLLARLAEKGKLSLDDPITKHFAELKVDSGFTKVTLTDLLTHRAGLASGADEMRQLPFLRVAKDATVARSQLAERMLTVAPLTPVGEFHYSNIGYALAGHIAERVTGKAYNRVLLEEVLEPLGITTAGFGAPATVGKTDQPYGHLNPASPVPPGPFADNPPGLAPAGTMHLSLRDWGKFLAVHLGGGPAGFLKSESLTRLHTPPDKADGTDANPRYALGWGRTSTRGVTTLTHAGSNTMFFCQVLLFPEDGWGVLAVTNCGNENGQKAVTEALKEIVALSRQP